MPVITDFSLPSCANDLRLRSDAAFFIAFIASPDPVTKQPWCPDVRDALPHIRAAFAEADGPEVALVEVGQKPEWKSLDNIFRKRWNIQCIPTLVRYQLVGDQVKEVGRLGEGELLDKQRLSDLVHGPAK